jgi:hypothetical protein
MSNLVRATNSSYPNTGIEIFVPGLGLLSEQNPLADRPISLGVRRAFSIFDRRTDRMDLRDRHRSPASLPAAHLENQCRLIERLPGE